MDDKPDILEIAQMYGLQLPGPKSGGRNITLQCPFHPDHGRPNMVIFTETNSFYCFRCLVGGDSWTLAGKLEYGDSWDRHDKRMFADLARKVTGKGVTKFVPSISYEYNDPELTRSQKNMVEFGTRLYHFGIHCQSGAQAIQYLEERGINKTQILGLRIGYAAPNLLASEIMRLSPKKRDEVYSSPLFLKSKGFGPFADSSGQKFYELLSERIVFPDTDKYGNVLSMAGRVVGKPKSDHVLRYLTLNGVPKTIWGLARCNTQKPIILTEGLFDVINLWNMGYQAITPLGTGINNRHDEKLKSLQLIILPQGDEPGIEAASLWKERFPQAKLLKIKYDPPGKENKDFNDIVRNMGWVEAHKILDASLLEVGLDPIEVKV